MKQRHEEFYAFLIKDMAEDFETEQKITLEFMDQTERNSPLTTLEDAQEDIEADL